MTLIFEGFISIFKQLTFPGMVPSSPDAGSDWRASEAVGGSGTGSSQNNGKSNSFYLFLALKSFNFQEVFSFSASCRFKG
jgi:hypothetical protein